MIKNFIMKKLGIVEVTGQPASGKSHYIKNLRNTDKKYNEISIQIIARLLYFYRGIRRLGMKRCMKLLAWSLKESCPNYYKLSIFFNAVSKFGRPFSNDNMSNDSILLVDEGISHIPFLFLNTDTKEVVKFLDKELSLINIHFLKSPNASVIKKRIISRGHKRLDFLPVDSFVKRNNEIEKILINSYNILALSLRVL
jgi:hypothetical protein